MTPKEYYSNTVKKTNITGYFISFLILYSLNFVFYYTNQNLLFSSSTFCSWLLLFALFDSVGYGLAIYNNSLWYLESIIIGGSIRNVTLEIFLYPYRIMQNFFMWYTVLQFVFVNYHISIACIISWWFGMADLLYYSMLRIPIDGKLPWMDNWSVHWVMSKLGAPCNRFTFYAMAIIGFLLSVLYLWWMVR